MFFLISTTGSVSETELYTFIPNNEFIRGNRLLPYTPVRSNFRHVQIRS